MEENKSTDIVPEKETYSIDVEHLVSSIEEMRSQNLFMSPNRCIFRTPVTLLRQNEKAYIPDAFSIGPFHHLKPYTMATETIKASYLQSLLKKTGSSNTMLKDMINLVKGFEANAREYYAGPIHHDSQIFVKMLLIDSCFIVELFYRNAFKGGKVENDPIFGTPSMLQVLDHDLILLENQVPWEILDHLFTISIGPICQKTLVELAIEFFRNVYLFTTTKSHDQPRHKIRVPHHIKHIPDLFKQLLVSSMEVDKSGKEEPYRWEPVPSATRLQEAGIKFRKSKSTNMFDIKFRNGVLEIPQIRIHEITETFMKNLISFEQCYPNSDDMITSYAILLDNLIDTTKDVEILRERDILSICMNSEDAVQFFNKLYHTTCVNNLKYMDLCKDLNAHCQKRWPRWRAVLVRRYFNTPWAGLSTGAAVTLLILSFLQTLFSIIK